MAENEMIGLLLTAFVTPIGNDLWNYAKIFFRKNKHNPIELQNIKTCIANLEGNQEYLIDLVEELQTEQEKLLPTQSTPNYDNIEHYNREIKFVKDIVLELMKEMNNIRDIISRSEKYFTEQSDASKLSLKFKNHFFETAAETEEEELRELLAKILAGEVNTPGLVFPITLNTLKLMTAIEVDSLNHLLKSIFYIGKKEGTTSTYTEIVIFIQDINTYSFHGVRNLESFNILKEMTINLQFYKNNFIELCDGTKYQINKPSFINGMQCYLTSIGGQITDILISSNKKSLEPDEQLLAHIMQNPNIDKSNTLNNSHSSFKSLFKFAEYKSRIT